MKRVLLVDGDVIAFRAAAAVQKTRESGAGYVWPFAHKAEGEAACDNMLYTLKLELKADEVRVFLSSPDNWRKTIYADYKANRAETVRPLLLTYLKDYLHEGYDAETWATLEADDVVSILMTEPVEDEERIIVGRDKDFKGIPGRYHAIGDRPGSFMETDVADANLFHLAQTLAGDRIDNYPGCPGIGMDRAVKLLADPQELVPEKGVITRGKNKGQATIKWFGKPTTDLWKCVVSNYLKAGLTEEDALRNARLAYMLRHEDYDREQHKINLWVPEKLKEAA